jgi:SAM-dependent methyltransferase
LSDPREASPAAEDVLQEEFERAASGFAERTKGRFDKMDPVGFSRVEPGAAVVEVGAGAGNFLSKFEEVAGLLVAVDLTHGMLIEARKNNPGISVVRAHGARLPIASRSIDLIMSAQAFHHIWEPIPVLRAMRSAMKPDGRMLLVDQLATESFEQIAFMNELEALRDPSHATSRPPSAFRIMVRQAGFEIEDERIVEVRNRFSEWMWPGEFPPERIERVRQHIDKVGAETGMEFRTEGSDLTFLRRRIMILARRAT